jgi:hypothetical protein
MKMLFSTCVILVTIFCSCQNNKTADSKATTTSIEDSLYKAVIALHDEVMPKIGKIKGYQKTVQGKIDSLTGVLQHEKNTAAKNLKSNYESLLDQLNTAEKGMNDWMDGFDPDPKLSSKEAIEKYWVDQKAKAKKMRDDILNAIDSSKANLSH